MNHNVEGPWHPSYVSSSLSHNETIFVNTLMAIQEEEEAVVQRIVNNNTMIARYMYQQTQQVTCGGSIPNHIVINHDREAADRNIFTDYFAENPRFNDAMFHQRFCMSRHLFIRIVDAVKVRDNYFMRRTDALGMLGLSTFQKATTVFQMLAYGIAADVIDEYVKIGESRTIERVRWFCCSVIEIFSEQYLRAPNAANVARLLEIGEKTRLPWNVAKVRLHALEVKKLSNYKG